MTRYFRTLIAVAVAVVLMAAGIAYASTPARQVNFGPGSAVVLTGATPAAPGATATGGVIVDTVYTLTNGYLADFRNNGTGKAHIDFNGVLTAAGIVNAGAVTNTSTATTTTAYSISANTVTTGQALKIVAGAEGTMTAAGSAIDVNDGTADIFRVGVDGHMTYTQVTAPVVTNTGGSVISCTDGAGTAAKCTDTRGVAIATTSASTNPIVVTFHTPFAIAPVCIVTPADATTETDFVSSTIKPVATSSTTALSITPAANWAVTAHKFNYICME